MACDATNPLTYGECIAAVPGKIVDKAGSGIMSQISDWVIQGVTDVLKTLGTEWTHVGNVDVDPSSNDVVAKLMNDVGWYTLLAAVVGLMIGAARIGLTARGEHGREMVQMLIRLVAVTAIGGLCVNLLLDAGNQFTDWILNQSTGSGPGGAASLVSAAALGQLSGFILLVLGPILIISSIVLLIFSIFRGPLLVIVIALWPTAVAMSMTEMGTTWHKRLQGWIIAFLLFKPIAAIVFSAGFLMLRSSHLGAPGDSPADQAMLSVSSGMAIICAAALVLPAIMKLVAPATSGGTGMSGGAAVGAAVAVGAVVASGGAAGAGAAGGATGAASGSAGSGGAAKAGTASGGSGGGGAGNAAGGGGPTGGGGPAGSADPSGSGGSGGPTGGGNGSDGSSPSGGSGDEAAMVGTSDPQPSGAGPAGNGGGGSSNGSAPQDGGSSPAPSGAGPANTSNGSSPGVAGGAHRSSGGRARQWVSAADAGAQRLQDSAADNGPSGAAPATT